MTNPEQIILTEFEDGAGVLIDLQRKRYYQLNETALLIWKSWQQGCTLPQIIRQVTEIYDISEAEISAHATQLMNEFTVRQLVVAA